MLYIILAVLLTETKTQDETTPSNFLVPRNYNHHSFEAEQFLKNLQAPKSTKKGPILFPNDGPPPPPRPLIVTSRPLTESIARSELNTTNNIAASSQLNHITRPGYLARVKEYRPLYPAVSFAYDFRPTEVPYAEVVKKVRDGGVRDNLYDDYEERTVLPPIYKVLSDYAQQNVLELQKSNQYQVQNPDYNNDYQNNDVAEGTSKEYNHGDNYAFSYAVKDKDTGDDFSHSQSSKGSATNGEYRVRLPDGRMQIVSYTADENGYKAAVRYDDENKSNGNSVDNHHNDYATRNDYVDNRNNYYGNQHKDYTVHSNDKADINAQNRNVQADYTHNPPSNDYYQYTDNIPKDYNGDYSSELNSNYPPYKSKFSFVDQTNDDDVVTVRPSYEELKDLFVNTDIYRARQSDIISRQTPNYDITTEKIVVIGTPKPTIFTNIRNILPVLSSPFISGSVTPRSYLVSTIANLKNRIHSGAKPLLSDSFIERINKYLKYK